MKRINERAVELTTEEAILTEMFNGWLDTGMNMDDAIQKMMNLESPFLTVALVEWWRG